MDSELVFPASAEKAFMGFLGSALLTIAYVWIARKSPIVGSIGAAVGVLAAAAFARMMLPNRVVLRLNPQGFELHGLFRTKKIAWSDVTSFRIRKIRGGQAIAFTYKQLNGTSWADKGPPGGASGSEGMVVNIYEVPLDSLFKSLVEWHARYSAGA